MTKPTANAEKLRRTWELQADSIADLATIKSHTPAKSDTAAIADALAFRALFAEHNSEEIHRALRALAVVEELESMTETGATLVTKARRGLLRFEQVESHRDDRSLEQKQPPRTLVAV